MRAGSATCRRGRGHAVSDVVTVAMPKLGESVTEGTLVKWLVKPGARVSALEIIAEVDTDKVSAEIPSPVSGTVQMLLVEEGTSIPVGGQIAVIESDAPATNVPAPAPAAAPAARVHVVTPAAAARPGLSPAVRELARTEGIDLSTLEGTGAGGRITRTDVLREVATLAERTAATPAQPAAAVDGDEVIPLTRMRRLIAKNMTLSKTTIPHAWQSQEVNMSGVVANRSANKTEYERVEQVSLTFLPYVVAAACVALRAHPLANATFDGDRIVVHKRINIGIAIGLEEGVIVPVIRDADGLSVAGLARAIGDLTARAVATKLTADDLSGGTFTVNNTGTFGNVVSYSVINPGQAGIITMGAIKERVVAVEGRIAIRPMMFLSFSLDHRVLDGLEGARFLSTCREWLEKVAARTSIH